jgi:sterol 3beta-glucosyltransferase
MALARHALPIAEEVIEGCYAAASNTDAIIHGIITTGIGHHLAVEKGIPDFSALTFPALAATRAFPSPSFPPWQLGGGYNRLTNAFATFIFTWGNRILYDLALRPRFPHLPRLRHWPAPGYDGSHTPILVGVGTHVVPDPFDWPSHAHLTGYWHLEQDNGWRPPEELHEFLNAGPPPVYFGFGSMVTSEAEHLRAVVTEALRRTGLRGLLLSGWGAFQFSDSPEFIYQLDEAPHDWLFPRMAALVHHGGAGTTGAALRSGVPNFVVPFTGDQPFWGQRVRQLGVGPPPVPRKRLTAQNLAAAIERMLADERMHRSAAELGAKLRAENGVARALELIEAYLA